MCQSWPGCAMSSSSYQKAWQSGFMLVDRVVEPPATYKMILGSCDSAQGLLRYAHFAVTGQRTTLTQCILTKYSPTRQHNTSIQQTWHTYMTHRTYIQVIQLLCNIFLSAWIWQSVFHSNQCLMHGGVETKLRVGGSDCSTAHYLQNNSWVVWIRPGATKICPFRSDRSKTRQTWYLYWQHTVQSNPHNTTQASNKHDIHIWLIGHTFRSYNSFVMSFVVTISNNLAFIATNITWMESWEPCFTWVDWVIVPPSSYQIHFVSCELAQGLPRYAHFPVTYQRDEFISAMYHSITNNKTRDLWMWHTYMTRRT